MNILFLTAYAPVLRMHGGGVRMYHNIRILSERHSVHVISFVENDEERRLLTDVGAICESVTAVERVPDFRPHWLSVKPFLVREFSTPAMYRAVDHALRTKRVDVIQCEYLQMAQYRRPGPFSILTIHEALSSNAYKTFQKAAPAERFRHFYRWMSILNYEIGMCNRFDRVVAMTKEDADYLRSYAHQAAIRDIPIGIDSAYFRPSAEETERLVEVLFIGNFRHAPNVEAADFVLKEIAPHFADLRFVIAGSHVPATLPALPNAVFPGYIADTRKLFHSPNTIFIAPLFSGTGQRVKLLEAFAMSCPVITTRLGALGFPILNGEQALVAETASEFRAALDRLLSSPALRVRIGNEARKMIVQRFDWATFGREFLALVGRATSPFPGYVPLPSDFCKVAHYRYTHA